MKYGLVLSGGGGKGAYELGVWKALVEMKLDKYIEVISGTSIGAFNAALFAQGLWPILKPYGMKLLWIS